MVRQPSLEQRLLDIANFCVERFKIVQATNPLDIPLRDRLGYYAHITDRTGKAYIQVGMESKRRIRRWSLDFLKRRNWTHLISVDECAKQLEREIGHHFFTLNREPTTSGISKTIAQLDEFVRAAVHAFRYCWPCHVCYGDKPAEFSVGDVRFRPSKVFGPELERGLATWDQPIDDAFREQVAGYFERFGWIADVTVETADPKAARASSLAAVQAALTVLRLFYGGGSESRMRTSEQQNYLLDCGEVYFEGETPHLSWQVAGYQAPLPDTWWEDLGQGDNAVRLKALGDIINSIIRPDEQTFLKRKFLSALTWFNDAANDTNASAKITKFVTVLEALASCNARENLAETVGNRIADMFGGYPGEGSRPDVKAKVKRVYVTRSEIVHGVRDPLDIELPAIAAEAGHLAHMTLVSFLDFMIAAGIDRTDFNNAKLRASFANLKANLDRLEGVELAAQHPVDGLQP